MMLLVIAFFGVLLRLAMLLSEKSYWGDEWFCVFAAMKPLHEVFRTAFQDVHPPLFTVLLHGVVKLAGPSELAFRSLSFLAGLGTLAVIYFLTRELFGRRAAALALFLAAISPYWLQSSNEIRSYSLLAFTTGLGTYFFVAWRKRGDSGKMFAAYLGCAVFAVYLEHYAWLWFFGTVFSTAWSSLRKEISWKWLRWQAVPVLAALPGLVLLVYQAIFRERMFDAGRFADYLSLPVLAKKFAGIFWHWAAGYHYSMLTTERIVQYAQSSAFFWLTLLAVASACWAVFSAWLSLRKKEPGFFALGLAVIFLPIILLTVFYPIRLDSRYLCFAAPLFFAFAAEGFLSFPKALRAIFLSVLGVVCVAGSLEAIQLKTDVIHREDFKGLFAYAAEKAGPADALSGFKAYREFYGVSSKAASFSDPETMSREEASRFEKIWVMDHTNMHKEAAEKMYQVKVETMKGLGFAPAEAPLRFGGEDGLLALYVFKKEGAVS